MINKKSKGTFLHYIHSFRGVAILFVVGGHILLQWEPNQFSEKIINSIFRNGTVLFVFIAGYLFQYLSGRFNAPEYWRKKILNVLLPYIIVSIPALILRFIETPRIVLLENPTFENWGIAKKIIYYISTGAHLQPLWFVPMITIFYLIAPVLNSGDKKKWLYKLLPLLLVLSLFVPRAELSNIIRMFIHFLSVYILGMFFSAYQIEITIFSKKWWPILTGVTLLLCILTFIDTPYYDNFMFLQKTMFCWFFIYWLDRFDSFIPKIFDTLADYSFGIFFTHYYFLLVFKFLSEKYAPIFITGSILNWVLHFSLIVVSNCLFIYIVRNILGKRSRYIIGT